MTKGEQSGGDGWMLLIAALTAWAMLAVFMWADIAMWIDEL